MYTIRSQSFLPTTERTWLVWCNKQICRNVDTSQIHTKCGMLSDKGKKLKVTFINHKSSIQIKAYLLRAIIFFHNWHVWTFLQKGKKKKKKKQVASSFMFLFITFLTIVPFPFIVHWCLLRVLNLLQTYLSERYFLT